MQTLQRPTSRTKRKARNRQRGVLHLEPDAEGHSDRHRGRWEQFGLEQCGAIHPGQDACALDGAQADLTERQDRAGTKTSGSRAAEVFEARGSELLRPPEKAAAEKAAAVEKVSGDKAAATSAKEAAASKEADEKAAAKKATAVKAAADKLRKVSMAVPVKARQKTLLAFAYKRRFA